METINFKSVEEILEFAIEQEQKTADLYIEMAEDAFKVELKELWTQLAEEELGHKSFMLSILDSFKKGESTCCSKQTILVEHEYLPIPERDYNEKEQIIVSAIHRDIKKIELYRRLAGKVHDVNCANLLMHIANQELKHKKTLLRDLNMINFY